MPSVSDPIYLPLLVLMVVLANPTVKIPDNSTASSSTPQESAKPGKSELMDFFASIEQEQPSMFDPQSQR